MWVYINMKNKEAPFICIYRITHPLSTSRMMCITDSKAIVVSLTKFIDNTSPVEI